MSESLQNLRDQILFRAIYQNSSDAIMTLDPPSWNFTSCNPACIKMFRVKNEKNFLSYQPWKELSPKYQSDGRLSEEKAKAMIEIAINEGSNYFEWTHRRLGGENFPATVLLTKIELPDKVFCQATVKDITKSKEIETNLKISEEKFRAVYEGAIDGILAADIESRNIFFGNESICKLIGYNKEELPKLNIKDIHPKYALPNLYDVFQKQAEKKIMVAPNIPVRKKDGTIIYCDISARPIKFDSRKLLLGFFRDVTSRRKLELEFQDEQFILKESQRVASIGSYKLDFNTGIWSSSDILNKIFGIREKYKKTVKSWLNIVHPIDRKLMDSYFIKDVLGKKKNFKKEYRIKRRNDGEVRWVSGLGNVTYDVKGKPIQMIGTIQDITPRKLIEEKLKINEKRYHQLYENLPAANFIIDRQGVTLQVNKFSKNQLGYLNSELIGFSIDKVFLPEDKSKVREQIEICFRHPTKIHQWDMRKIRKNGEVIWVHEIARAMMFEDKLTLLISCIDITERKRIEEENKWLASFPILNPNPIIEVSMKDNIFYINPVAKKLFPDMHKKQLNHDFVAGLTEYLGMMDNIQKKLEPREAYINGHWYLKTFSVPRPGHLRIYAIDITRLKNAEESILQSKNRIEAILESIGDAVFACDTKGKIILFNKMAEILTGKKRNDVVGKNYSKVVKFVRESDGKPCNDFIAEAINKDVITEMANHAMLVREDGIQIPVADSAAPIKDSNEKLIGCVVVFHEMTKERKIDKAKTEFVSLASHQLRTPLSTINWYSEILLSEDIGLLNPKQKQYSQEVYHASQRMVALVNALLNVSRIELGTFAVEPKLINIVKIAKMYLKDLKPQITLKKLIIKEKYDKRIAPINVDPKLMGIIFQNLFSNAVKYSKKSGNVEISIGQSGENLILTVADSGIGIPTSQQKEIFTKLFRADNAKMTDPDGSGLGLYIVKEIINYTGGTVWFESKEGKGSKFYASLPMSGMKKNDNTKQLI